MTSIIRNWTGRSGNNIIQVINCIYYSFYINGFEKICFPKHFLLRETTIKSQEEIKEKNITKTNPDNFFYARKLNFSVAPKEMREITQKYLVPITTLNLDKPIVDNSMVIHLRGGDTMTKGNHQMIIPWKYYKTILDKNTDKKITVVYEDETNSCLEKFKKIPNVTIQSKILKEDLETLCSGEIFIISISTLDILVFCFSKYLKKIYIPSNVVNDEWYPDMDWGVKTNILSLKNYKKEVWLNLTTKEKKKLLLEYDDEINFLDK